MIYQEINGDLIKLAKEGTFDVIAHGCNCQCIMGSGLAPQMAVNFDCNVFSLENKKYKGDINKLGQIDWEFNEEYNLFIVNAYTQFDITGRKQGKIDLDYDALALCFKKMNHIFKGKHIGLPQIGCHLAGGDWTIVKKMIQDLFTDCTVTVVNYKP